MPTYKAPTREYGFLLHELLDLSRFSNLPGFAEATPDLLDQIMEQAAKFTEEVLQPLNKVGDEQGCTLKDGEVTTGRVHTDEAGYAEVAVPESGFVLLNSVHIARPDTGAAPFYESFWASMTFGR